MISWANNNATSMNRIITGDETWVTEFDMKASQQSPEWRLEDEPKSKKRMQREK